MLYISTSLLLNYEAMLQNVDFIRRLCFLQLRNSLRFPQTIKLIGHFLMEKIYAECKHLLSTFAVSAYGIYIRLNNSSSYHSNASLLSREIFLFLCMQAFMSILNAASVNLMLQQKYLISFSSTSPFLHIYSRFMLQCTCYEIILDIIKWMEIKRILNTWNEM